jgi:hypothetical protein
MLSAAWWYTFSRVHQSADPVFLHYNIIFGIDLIGEWWKLWFIPAFGTALFLINLIISYLSYGRDKIISRLVGITTVCLEIFILIGLLLIIGINS